jgi:type II secretory pathway component GspD/PulD (secretin)
MLGSDPSIVADNRLNSLFVQGTPTQIDLIGQLLEVIDQESGPEEVLTNPKPKFIPVYYTSAESVAEVLRQVYATRIVGESNGQGGRSPQDFMRQMRGGGDRGGDRGGNTQSQTDEPKMSIGVDTGSNSLIVSAPGPLLKEVETVVAELDRRANMDTGENVAVVTLKRTNPEAIQQSLSNLFGDMVTTNGGSGGSRGGTSTSARGPTSGPSPEDMQRRMEFINRMRAGFGGGPPGGFRGGGPGGGTTRGGGGDGGRGGRGR